ncbi:hypothetical protein BCR39DRAFT_540125 [Naematelia encephala]|uniref:DUF4185 domain-containing protein n=1 Tax=Naematelia encephala TaxID=71784 RepID=A0A1Y2AVZ4_9TREE|nr:hypothetical protein BCR39DRAFT_540125 [Naematelia encephala]
MLEILLAFIPLCSLLTQAAPLHGRSTPNPVVKTATLYGPISETEPVYLDRDSCGSTKWGDRVLFVCRDTEVYKDLANRSEGVTAFFSSSASYIDINSDGSLSFVPFTPEPGTPDSESHFNYSLPAYGANNNKAFYPTQPDECDAETGSCDNNSTRWVIWPDSPPLVSSEGADGTIKAYSWIKKAYITDSLGVIIENPAISLYRLDYSPSIQGTGDVLPAVTLVNEEFFHENQWTYGDFGNIVIDDTAYLFAATGNGTTSLAKVPIGSEEDVSAYQYFVSGAWTSTMPSINDPNAIIIATSGGQGTFYFSQPWNSYVWIGQAVNDGSLTFQITTAPAIEGPWTVPKTFFSVASSPGLVYSVQAHPAFLSDPSINSVWVSYTVAINNYGYDTILYKFDWE